ncbi:MAG: CsgE family curli-type amyloid fiber assembly protein [Flavobacteriaceae bacterium]
MSRNLSFSLVLVLIGITLSFSQNEATIDSIQAKIKIVKKDNFITIYAKALNHSKTIQSELKYSILALKKSDTGNLSRNVQSGEFSMEVDEEKLLSTQQLNIGNKDIIKVYLFVRKNKVLISKDSLFISAVDEIYNTSAVKESDMEMSGLVVENTMTKLGKDFYDFFGQVKQLNNVKYPFIIIINEKPALGGRNSEVSIVINDQIIYRFRTQPKEEYLYNQAQEANRKIYNYYIKSKTLKKKNKLF